MSYSNLSFLFKIFPFCKLRECKKRLIHGLSVYETKTLVRYNNIYAQDRNGKMRGGKICDICPMFWKAKNRDKKPQRTERWKQEGWDRSLQTCCTNFPVEMNDNQFLLQHILFKSIERILEI